MIHLTESLVLTWGAAAAGVALLLVLVAWRGRRVDDHPLCRKCGFDLFGLPSTSDRCPECGRDLTRRRATRLGHRRKRRRLLALGLLCLLLATGLLGVVTVTRARGVNWQQYKSVSWLIADTRSHLVASQDAAFDEITRRLTQRILTDEQIKDLADTALAHQADRSQAWLPRWGLFIEEANKLGRLPASAWVRYAQQAADRYEFDVRDTIRRGALLPVRVRNLPERVGTPGRFAYFPQMGYDVDGQLLLPLYPSGLTDFNAKERVWRTGCVDQLLPFPRPTVVKLAPGLHQAGVTLEVIVVEDRWGIAGAFAYPELVPRQGPSGPEVTRSTLLTQYGGITRESRPSKAFQIIEAPQPPIALHYDETTAPEIEKSIEITAKRTGPAALAIELRSAPQVSLAFDARGVVNDLSYDLGSIVLPAKRPEIFELAMQLEPDLRQFPDKINLVLTPSPLAAECTLDIKQIWAGVVLRTDIDVDQLAYLEANDPTKQRR